MNKYKLQIDFVTEQEIKIMSYEQQEEIFKALARVLKQDFTVSNIMTIKEGEEDQEANSHNMRNFERKH